MWRGDHSTPSTSVSSATGWFCWTQHENRLRCGTFIGPLGRFRAAQPADYLQFPKPIKEVQKETLKAMSKKPLADDRRRELATEAFAKIVRAAFKGETDKAKESLAIIESQFAEEIDILDRARRFGAMNLTRDTSRTGRPRNVAERLLAGIISLNAGDLDAAEKDIDAVLAEEPKNGDAHYALAVVRTRREKVDEALASLKTACSLSAERRAQAPLDSEFAAFLGNPAFEALTAA